MGHFMVKYKYIFSDNQKNVQDKLSHRAMQQIQLPRVIAMHVGLRQIFILMAF